MRIKVSTDQLLSSLTEKINEIISSFDKPLAYIYVCDTIYKTAKKATSICLTTDPYNRTYVMNVINLLKLLKGEETTSNRSRIQDLRIHEFRDFPNYKVVKKCIKHMILMLSYKFSHFEKTSGSIDNLISRFLSSIEGMDQTSIINKIRQIITKEEKPMLLKLLKSSDENNIDVHFTYWRFLSGRIEDESKIKGIFPSQLTNNIEYKKLQKELYIMTDLLLNHRSSMVFSVKYYKELIYEDELSYKGGLIQTFILNFGNFLTNRAKNGKSINCNEMKALLEYILESATQYFGVRGVIYPKELVSKLLQSMNLFLHKKTDGQITYIDDLAIKCNDFCDIIANFRQFVKYLNDLLRVRDDFEIVLINTPFDLDTFQQIVRNYSKMINENDVRQRPEVILDYYHSLLSSIGDPKSCSYILKFLRTIIQILKKIAPDQHLGKIIGVITFIIDEIHNIWLKLCDNNPLLLEQHNILIDLNTKLLKRDQNLKIATQLQQTQKRQEQEMLRKYVFNPKLEIPHTIAKEKPLIQKMRNVIINQYISDPTKKIIKKHKKLSQMIMGARQQKQKQQQQKKLLQKISGMSLDQVRKNVLQTFKLDEDPISLNEITQPVVIQRTIYNKPSIVKWLSQPRNRLTNPMTNDPLVIDVGDNIKDRQLQPAESKKRQTYLTQHLTEDPILSQIVSSIDSILQNGDATERQKKRDLFLLKNTYTQRLSRKKK